MRIRRLLATVLALAAMSAPISTAQAAAPAVVPAASGSTGGWVDSGSEWEDSVKLDNDNYINQRKKKQKNTVTGEEREVVTYEARVTRPGPDTMCGWTSLRKGHEETYPTYGPDDPHNATGSATVADWRHQVTPFGLKPTVIGVCTDFIRYYKEFRAQAGILGSGFMVFVPDNWINKGLRWDAPAAQNVISSNWTRKKGGSDWYDAGWGFCAATYAVNQFGPYLPMRPTDKFSQASFDAWKAPATFTDGTPWTWDMYNTSTGEHKTDLAKAPGNTNMDRPSSFINECYQPNGFVPLPAALSGNTAGNILIGRNKAVHYGRYETEVLAEGKDVKIFRVESNNQAFRQNLTGGLHVVEPSAVNRTDTTTSPGSGIASTVSTPMRTNVSVTYVSYSCRGTFRKDSGSAATSAWPDGNSRAYYGADPKNCSRLDSDAVFRGGPTQNRSEFFGYDDGNNGDGLVGFCVNATAKGALTTPQGVKNRVGALPTEIQADNLVNTLDYDGTSVDVWLMNKGWASAVGRNVTFGTRWMLGGVAPQIPATVSPSLVGTFPNGVLDLAAANDAAIQPFGTVKWDDIDNYRDRQARGNVEPGYPASVWQPVGTTTWGSKFDEGIGLRFSKPSSVDVAGQKNSFAMQPQYTIKGTFEVRTPYIKEYTLEANGGDPVFTPVIAYKTDWALRQFSCTPPASMLRAISVVD